MKRSKKKSSAVLPVILSVGMCATSAGVAVIAVPESAYANSAIIRTNQKTGSANVSADEQLPPVRETLTRKEAEDLPGCESIIDNVNKEVVIRPKGGADEGVISYSLDNKKGDFTKIRTNLIFNDLGDHFPVRFDKRVYIYDSTEPSANDTLFYQMYAETINITPNLSIKFAQNLATFFMQNFSPTANRLHYIKGVENWDTSHITSMEKMFNLASQLKGNLDLSKWDISAVDKLNLMFSGVGNEDGSFVLDFSNKKFKNSADVMNMFNSFRGVLVANNWKVADPNGSGNPIQNLLNSPTSILTHWDSVARKYTGPSLHLLITDNPIILEKNKTEQYKFYKKVKVIYKNNNTEKSTELELPAVYDSRIDENGKPDTTKPASADAMKVVKSQIDVAIKNAVDELRTKNPSLNLPENVIPVPVKEIVAGESPVALFQDYYLATVKEETSKAKTIFTPDPSLTYKETVYDVRPQDGKKQVITGKMENGVWNPNAIVEKQTTPAQDGKVRVGNKDVKTETIQPKTTYVADSNLAYNSQQETAGEAGAKTTTILYKVDPNNGLTNTVESTDSKETKPVKNKIIKIGNIQEEHKDVSYDTTYEADSSLDYKATNEIAGAKGTKTIYRKMKVDPDKGLTDKVESTNEKVTTPAKNKIIKVGNVNTKKTIIPFKTTYIADDTLTYNHKEDKIVGKDGSKTVTTTYKVNKSTGLTTEVDNTQEKTVDPTNRVVRVGNKQVTHEGNKTITTTYDVDKNTGDLTNPKKHTSMPIGTLSGSTKTEIIKGVMKYEADDTLPYNTQKKINDPVDGKKTTTTVINGEPKVEVVAAQDGLTKVGNKEVKTEDITPGTTYEADSSLDYKATNEIAGVKGTKTVTTVYKVDPTKGLTTEIDGQPTTTTTPAKNKIIKIGNIKKEKKDIQFNITYLDDNTLDKGQTVVKTKGKNGSETIVTTYKVNSATGVTDEVVSTEKENQVPAVDEVICRGTKESTPTPPPAPHPNPNPPVQLQKTVIFKNSDDSQIVSVKVEVGKAIATDSLVDQSMPKDPVKENYTFKEWNTQKDGNGVKFTGDTPVDNDMTVYAVYTKNPVTPPAPNPPVPNPNPPQPQHDNSEPAVLDTQEAEVLSAKMKYEADDTLPYNTRKKITDPVDGLKITTHTGSFVNGKWTPSDEVKITAAQNGLTKVGNKQVTHEGNKTITTTYDVDENTGDLSNPHTHTSMPMSTLIKPAQHPNHKSAPTQASVNQSTGMRESKHLRGESMSPNTGDSSSLGGFFSALGLSIAGLVLLRKKKSMKKDK